MSLDVYLKSPEKRKVTCHYCGQEHDENEQLYEANITHNLGKMAKAAGIYTHLWRPEELGITVAKDLIEPLRAGLKKLITKPEKFIKLNPENGWGTYDLLVRFTSGYVAACEKYPDALIGISR